MRGNVYATFIIFGFVGCTRVGKPVAPPVCAPDDQACIAEATDGSNGGAAVSGGDGASGSGSLTSGVSDGSGNGNGTRTNGSGNANGTGTNGTGTNGTGTNGTGNGANGSNGLDGAMSGSSGPATCGNGMVEMGETCDPPASCPTLASCQSPNKCLMPTITGAPNTCNARCEMVEIEACVAGDGCCPKACNAMSDSDCSASCGNGVVEAGETCEPTSSTIPCPTTCDDMDVCTKDVETGSAAQCNLTCTNTPITAPAAGDQCCPPGANANNDTDCKAKCGNMVKEPGETCDGNCPETCDDKDPCTTDTMTGSAAECTIVCKNTPITKPMAGDGCCPDGANSNNDSDCSAMCGNGVKEGNEKCDGADCPSSCDDGKPCTADAMVGSAAKCTAECTHKQITSPSSGDGCCPSGANSLNDNDCEPKCGNGVMEAGEKCDGSTCNKSCTPLNKCSSARLTGSPSSCNVECIKNDVTPCCGDGKREGSETCDGDCDRITCATDSPCKSPNRLGSNSQCNVTCGTPTIKGTNGGRANICEGCNALKYMNPGGGDISSVSIGGTCNPLARPECSGAGALYCIGTESLGCRSTKTGVDDGCTGNELQDDDCDGKVDENVPSIGCPPKGDF